MLSDTTKKILIVDDCTEAADSFKDILELFGYQAQCVYEWQQVLNLVTTVQFSIIFMDINLKEMSGTTLLKNIRSTAANHCRDTKFIAVSGYSADDPIGFEASQLFDFYLQKPINLDDLETLLASLHT